MFKSTICFLLTLSCVYSLHLPSTFKRCHHNDTDIHITDCLSEAIKNAIKQLDKPIEEYGLPSLEPLKIPEILRSGNSSTGIEETISNIRMSGHTSIKAVKVSIDRLNKKLSLKLMFETLKEEVDYEVHGYLIYYKIDTKTNVTVKYIRPTLVLNFKLEEYEKNNEKHLRVVDGDWNVIVKDENVAVKFDKLFPNESLNEAYNELVSSYWTSLLPSLIELYRKTVVVDIYGRVFNNLLERVPKSEIF